MMRLWKHFCLRSNELTNLRLRDLQFIESEEMKWFEYTKGESKNNQIKSLKYHQKFLFNPFFHFFKNKNKKDLWSRVYSPDLGFEKYSEICRKMDWKNMGKTVFNPWPKNYLHFIIVFFDGRFDSSRDAQFCTTIFMKLSLFPIICVGNTNMDRANQLFIDGTFKISPKKFKQMIIIMACFKDAKIFAPVLYGIVQ
ncbi:hypothetical protein M0811_14554 [Anaeramoeba ignava]|uniref:Uncharacterized protein n=1 Tax=Anaeramoeba ignava TaxID=1746090 RepID=A0A9Q0LWI0_ANAIG|nr:hypothetical protein M0811_14554 [Anaeramoeba ignava]